MTVIRYGGGGFRDAIHTTMRDTTPACGKSPDVTGAVSSSKEYGLRWPAGGLFCTQVQFGGLSQVRVGSGHTGITVAVGYTA